MDNIYNKIYRNLAKNLYIQFIFQKYKRGTSVNLSYGDKMHEEDEKLPKFDKDHDDDLNDFCDDMLD